MAEAKANQAALEADRAKMKAVQDERERIEKERRDAGAKAEKEKIALDAKKAKQTHRAKIHKEAKTSLVKAGLSDDAATNIVTAIKDGLIKHVKIEY